MPLVPYIYSGLNWSYHLKFSLISLHEQIIDSRMYCWMDFPSRFQIQHGKMLALPCQDRPLLGLLQGPEDSKERLVFWVMRFITPFPIYIWIQRGFPLSRAQILEALLINVSQSPLEIFHVMSTPSRFSLLARFFKSIYQWDSRWVHLI